MFWPFKIFYVLIRNQLWMIPKANLAEQNVQNYLFQNGFNPKSVKLGLGLAEPSNLTLTIVFESDLQLSEFESSGGAYVADKIFQDSLKASRYPAEVPSKNLTFYSHEEIMREGGYERFING